ncbi:MAG: GGDEF domain-containing protein, partial [Myxococcales bacterium]|nr:GGDEF domain-containing protein [Myxococcales bacterium]
GYAEGDAVLAELTELLRASVRPDDRVCRYGGEEYVLLMPDFDGIQASLFADRLRSKVAEHRFTVEGTSKSPSLTVSIGVASVGTDAPHPEALLELANDALRIAKRSGGNQVVHGGR